MPVIEDAASVCRRLEEAQETPRNPFRRQLSIEAQKSLSLSDQRVDVILNHRSGRRREIADAGVLIDLGRST